MMTYVKQLISTISLHLNVDLINKVSYYTLSVKELSMTRDQKIDFALYILQFLSGVIFGIGLSELISKL